MMPPLLDICALSEEFDQLWSSSPRQFRERIKKAVRSILGDAAASVWAPWMELVATEFLFLGFESYKPWQLTAWLSTICAQVAGDAQPSENSPFPREIPEPYWSNWPSLNEPPPLKRLLPVLRCPDRPEWEEPAYDRPEWDVLYDMLVRMTHIGDFDMMEVYPLGGVDPIIVREPEVVLDHALTARPPMGLAVARLLARQIAYDYTAEHGRYQVAAWIYSSINRAPRSQDARPPDWLTSELSAGFVAMTPKAMFTFCERAIADLDRLCVR